MLDDVPRPLRECIALADAESRRLRHGYIGSEHLLLGLLRMRGSRAAEALGRSDVHHARVSAFLTGIVGMGDEDVADVRLPFTTRAAGVVRRVVGEAERDGSPAIGSEHVLRALLRSRDGVAARILSDLGVDTSTLADALRRPRPDP